MTNEIFKQFIQAHAELDSAQSTVAALRGQLQNERNNAYLVTQKEAMENPLYALLSEASGLIGKIYHMQKTVEATYVDWHFDDKEDWTFTRYDKTIEQDAAPIMDALQALEKQCTKTRDLIYGKISKRNEEKAEEIYSAFIAAKEKADSLAEHVHALYEIMLSEVQKNDLFRAKLAVAIEKIKGVVDIIAPWDFYIAPFIKGDTIVINVALKVYAKWEIDIATDDPADEMGLKSWMRHDFVKQLDLLCGNLEKTLDTSSKVWYSFGSSSFSGDILEAEECEEDDDLYDQEDRYIGMVTGTQEIVINFEIKEETL